ncbi:ABC transporter [Microbacterium album]|uniref:Uncharacterized protein n=1 Tax=Microbacterium album TaxID=2053191 RepID=A0A917MLL1_9MICO|nr:ABC transporter [Microbacterium album]GGH41551.1 hypothetical protein GCM10010921_14220 [Microbacterium album]
MSDAQGSYRDPSTGEPIEENADLEPAGSTDEQPATPDAPAGDASAGARAADDAAAADSAPDATPTVVARASDDEPVTRPEPGDPQPTESADEEPDYAALAAELDELERRMAPPREESAGDERAGDERPAPWFEPADRTQTLTAADEAPTQVAPAVTPSEPVTPEPSAPAAPPPAQLPVFVQAPEPPRKRGNRGAAAAIGLLAALAFAILYFAATLAHRALLGDVDLANIADVSLQLLASFALWVPVVAFFLGFWLLGVIVNRARWAAWVLLGVFVGLAAYAGHIGGQLFEAPFWLQTPSEARALIEDQLLSPLAIAAFVLGREITIWFGAWVARRGARVTAQNEEAQAEYERTIEAGPRLG